MKRYKTVDAYIAGTAKWQKELTQLRKILQAARLVEEIKWGAPCYTFNGKNVVGMAAFKSYFGLWFHQGALLNDDKCVLINAQEGTTRALRQWRMNSARDIKPRIISAYSKEATQLVMDGRSIGPQKKKPSSFRQNCARQCKRISKHQLHSENSLPGWCANTPNTYRMLKRLKPNNGE